MGGGYSIIGASKWLMTGNKHFGRDGFLRAQATWRPEDLDVDLTGQNHLVTGANAGLGRAAAEALARRHASVHLLCRNRERGEAARREIAAATGNPSVHLHVVDVSDAASVRAFAEAWNASGAPVHALINNAGVLPAERTLTREGHEAGWATMMMQSYLLTGLLIPSLLRAQPRPARVINVSSGGQYTVRLDIDDPQCTASCSAAEVAAAAAGAAPAAGAASSGSSASSASSGHKGRKYDGKQQYAHTKRAQIMLTELWAAEVAKAEAAAAHTAAATGGAEASTSAAAGTGVSTPPAIVFNAMHPGWAETPGVTASIPDFAESHKGSLRTPEQGADTIVWLAASAAGGRHTGGFWFDRAPAETDFSWSGTRSSPAEFAQLWAKCAAWTGYAFRPEEYAAAAKAAAAGAAVGPGADAASAGPAPAAAAGSVTDVPTIAPVAAAAASTVVGAASS